MPRMAHALGEADAGACGVAFRVARNGVAIRVALPEAALPGLRQPPAGPSARHHVLEMVVPGQK